MAGSIFSTIIVDGRGPTVALVVDVDAMRTREILVSVTFRAFRRVSTLFVHFPSALSSPRAHARTRSGYCTAVHRKEQKLPVDLTLSTSTCDSIEIISINPMVLK